MVYKNTRNFNKNDIDDKTVHELLNEALNENNLNISYKKQLDSSEVKIKSLEKTNKEQKSIINKLNKEIEEQQKLLDEQREVINLLKSGIEDKEICIENLKFQLSQKSEELKELKTAEYFKQLSIDKRTNCLKNELEELKNDNKKPNYDVLKLTDIDDINSDVEELEFDNFEACVQPLFSSSKIIDDSETLCRQKWILHFSGKKASYVIWDGNKILTEGVVLPKTEISVEHHQLLVFDAIFKKKIKFDFESTISILSNSNIERIYKSDYQVYYKKTLPLAKYIYSKLKNFKSIEFDTLIHESIDKIFNYCIELEAKTK
uniref:Csm1 domain-containing protein n=1 Tax=Strongyloides venezuelensis TaxID=75913 RepID=A0A0K0FB87_STRVS